MSEEKSIPASPTVLGRLNRLYESRRVLLPPMGERALPQMAIALILALALMSILMSLAWVQKSDIDYLRGSSGVAMLDGLTWNLELGGKTTASVPLSVLGDTSVKQLAGSPFKISTEVDAKTMAAFMDAAGESPVVLSLPAIEYERLDVQAAWLPARSFARGEQTILVFGAKATAGIDHFTLSLTVWPHNTQERIIRSTVNMVPAFLGVQARYQKYQDFLAGRRTGSGKQLADIGRIVLAVFSVFLFIFIDSSPECLALGMFMSLKALAVAVGQGWLPDSMFEAQTMTHARNFLLSFADFMQLYFFTQLARLWRPRPVLWLLAGALFGTCYAAGAAIVPVPGGINWPFHV